MADQRTFTLIGEFKDNITSSLDGINRSIAELKQTMATMTTKRGGGFGDVTQSVGKLISAQKHLSNSIKEVGDAARAATGELKEYKNVVGKIASAHYHIGKSGQLAGNRIAKDWESAGKNLGEYTRRITHLSKMGRRTRLRNPTAPYFAEPRTRRTSRAMTPAGDGEMDVVAQGPGLAGAVFGNQLANMITAGVIRGFEVGVSIMQKPFQAFANALGERISDELGDLQAAGGLFAISKRLKEPFVRDFDQAIELQQKMNLSMAKMANALPGSTQDFVEVQKRVTDTIGRVVTGNLKGSTEIANQILASEEGKKFYGGKQLNANVTTKEERAELTRENINVISGELTKLTVLAGLTGGGRGGGGVRGAMGPYGLPGLAERMISDDAISMGSMQRYAAIFRDPAIKDALERNIPKLNAAIAQSPERITAFFEMMREIVTPELIAKLRRSTSGLNEAIRSVFFTPESGILGLGRKLKDMGVKYNDFGQAVDKNGKAVEGMTEAAEANLGLYEVLRDIYANTAAALMPIIENLGAIFDPLQIIGNVLKDARAYSAQFLKNFYYYRNSLEKYAKDLGGMSGKELLGSLDLRASLLNINNLFRGLGVFSSKEFESTTDLLLDPSYDPVDLISGMIKKFFSSEAATALGEQIGEVIGTVLKQVSDLMTSIVDGLGNEMGPGFAKGFQKAGGFAAIQNIFVQLMKMLLTAAATVIKEMPGVAITGTILALAPALIGAAVTKLVEGLFAGGLGRGALQGAAAGAGGVAAGAAGRRGVGAVLAGLFSLGPTPAMKGARAAAGAGVAAAAAPAIQGARMMAAVVKSAALAVPVLGKTLQVVNAARKFIPGGAVLGAGIDFALAKATGQSTGKAIAGAVGSVLGGTLGSFFGPLGTVAGTMLGSTLGNVIYSNFTPAGKAQAEAAALQKQAADLQLIAAKNRDLSDKYKKYGVGDLFYNFGQSREIDTRLDALGYASNALVNVFKKEYLERNVAIEDLKLADAALEEVRTRLTAANTDPKTMGRVLKPLEDNVKTAADRLKNEQDELSIALSKLPIKIQDALLKNLMNVSWQKVVDARAQRVALTRQLNAQGGGRGGTDKGKAASTPTKSNAYGEPGKNFSSLHRAVAYENRHKPPGSSLVIANSSETIIPANGIISAVSGYMPNFSKMAGALARNQGPSSPIKYDEGMGGYVPNPGAGRPANVRYKGFPQAYLSPTRPSLQASAGNTRGAGGYTLNNSISIQQQPGESMEDLAATVVQYMSDWVSDARGATLFV